MHTVTHKLVRSTVRKLREIERLFKEAAQILNQLDSENYNRASLSQQWERQKECQLAAMANESQQSLEEELVSLLDLEEELGAAQ